MAVVDLTAAYVKALPTPETGSVEVWDQRTPGLCLRLFASGKGSWSFRYRPRSGAGYQRLTLGALSSLTLAEARDRARQHRVAVQDGHDPQKVRKAARHEARTALTLDELAQRYIDEYAKPRKTSWRNDEGYLKRARAAWSRKAAAEITRRDVVALLDEIRRTAPISANRTQTVLITMMNWAVESELLPLNPIAGLKKRAAETAKDRTLTDDELRVLWRALSAPPQKGPGRTHVDVADALKLLVLTGQRPGEVAGMMPGELQSLDVAAEARWEIPAVRMKARRSHVVPLAPQAFDVVQRALARREEDGDGRAVFASKFTSRDALARHSLSQAMRRIIAGLLPERGEERAVASLQAEPPTPHDLRRTVGTGLARLGVLREDRKAVLAHVEADVHGVHYDRYERLAEKRAALVRWEAHIGRVCAPPARVLERADG